MCWHLTTTDHGPRTTDHSLPILIVVLLFIYPAAGFVFSSLKLGSFLDCNPAVGFRLGFQGVSLGLSGLELHGFSFGQRAALYALLDPFLLPFLTIVNDRRLLRHRA